MPNSIRALFCVALVTLVLRAVDPPRALAGDGELEIYGQVWGQALGADAPTSWRQGGFGRLDVDDETALARADLMLEWRPATTLSATLAFYLHATARLEPDELSEVERTGAETDPLGVVEAYAELSVPVGSANTLGIRAGHFLLPTSRENVDLGWSSPYTLGFSTLNTWIGEEVRPTGVELRYDQAVGDIDTLQLGGSVFWNNDTAGTLLAWRGWAFSDRLTTFGENLPLPPLPALADGGGFGEQRDLGTRPFGEDLDGRAGWAGWVRYRSPERFDLQYTHYDNRGDRDLHQGEYAWRTRFDLAGFEWHRGAFDFAAEWMDGSTGMGLAGGPNVQLDFQTTYALVSWRGKYLRTTVRWEEFESRDRDGSLALDPNDDDGEAWTLSLLVGESIWQSTRLGLEWLDVEGNRPAAGLAGFDTETGGESWKLELRWYFGS